MALTVLTSQIIDAFTERPPSPKDRPFLRTCVKIEGFLYLIGLACAGYFLLRWKPESHHLQLVKQVAEPGLMLAAGPGLVGTGFAIKLFEAQIRNGSNKSIQIKHPKITLIALTCLLAAAIGGAVYFNEIKDYINKNQKLFLIIGGAATGGSLITIFAFLGYQHKKEKRQLKEYDQREQAILQKSHALQLREANLAQQQIQLLEIESPVIAQELQKELEDKLKQEEQRLQSMQAEISSERQALLERRFALIEKLLESTDLPADNELFIAVKDAQEAKKLVSPSSAKKEESSEGIARTGILVCKAEQKYWQQIVKECEQELNETDAETKERAQEKLSAAKAKLRELRAQQDYQELTAKNSLEEQLQEIDSELYALSIQRKAQDDIIFNARTTDAQKTAARKERNTICCAEEKLRNKKSALLKLANQERELLLCIEKCEKKLQNSKVTNDKDAQLEKAAATEREARCREIIEKDEQRNAKQVPIKADDDQVERVSSFKAKVNTALHLWDRDKKKLLEKVSRKDRQKFNAEEDRIKISENHLSQRELRVQHAEAALVERCHSSEKQQQVFALFQKRAQQATARLDAAIKKRMQIEQQLQKLPRTVQNKQQELEELDASIKKLKEELQQKEALRAGTEAGKALRELEQSIKKIAQELQQKESARSLTTVSLNTIQERLNAEHKQALLDIRKAEEDGIRQIWLASPLQVERDALAVMREQLNDEESELRAEQQKWQKQRLFKSNAPTKASQKVDLMTQMHDAERVLERIYEEVGEKELLDALFNAPDDIQAKNDSEEATKILQKRLQEFNNVKLNLEQLIRETEQAKCPQALDTLAAAKKDFLQHRDAMILAENHAHQAQQNLAIKKLALYRQIESLANQWYALALRYPLIEKENDQLHLRKEAVELDLPEDQAGAAAVAVQMDQILPDPELDNADNYVKALMAKIKVNDAKLESAQKEIEALAEKRSELLERIPNAARQSAVDLIEALVIKARKKDWQKIDQQLVLLQAQREQLEPKIAQADINNHEFDAECGSFKKDVEQLHNGFKKLFGYLKPETETEQHKEFKKRVEPQIKQLEEFVSILYQNL